MNCKRCSSHFSDLVENELEDSMEAKVRAHLADCSSCQRDLNDFLQSLNALRDVLRHSPEAIAPADLEGRIATSLASASPSSLSSPDRSVPIRAESATSEPKSARRRRVLLTRLAAAAALLLMLTVGFLAGQEGWLSRWTTVKYRSPPRDASSDQRGAKQEAEDQLRQAKRIDAQMANVRLELLETFRSTTQKRDAEFAKALQTSKHRNARMQAHKDELEKNVTALETRVDELETNLRHARRQTRELQLELAEHQRVRADLEERLTEQIDALTRAETESTDIASEESTGLPDTVSASTVPRFGAERVIFRRRGDTLEVYGPPAQVIPALFRAAREAEDPAQASLALNHLETLLPMASAAEPKRRTENAGYFRSIGEKIASLADPLDLRPQPELACGATTAATPGTLTIAVHASSVSKPPGRRAIRADGRLKKTKENERRAGSTDSGLHRNNRQAKRRLP